MSKKTSLEILTAELDADTLEMLRIVARKLKELGYVKDGYEETLIKREEKYPTGLAVEELINIAIPHTEVEYVLRQALVLIKHPDSYFYFQKMDEPDKYIPVKIAFLLVVKESKGYVRFLADLTELFQDYKFIEVMKEERLVSIARFLEDKLDKHNPRYKGQLDLP
jgi:PTS system galactitol-specific IIA component